MIVSGGVEILPVGSKAELDRFIRVPMRLGERDPNYIAPLMIERGESLTATLARADASMYARRRHQRTRGGAAG